MAATTFSFPRTAIVGQGRMGTALANAMRRVDFPVDGPLGRGADFSGVELAILCVPDAQIRAAAERCPPNMMLAHCSGVTTLEPLAMHEAFSFHPLMTVTKETADFAGAGCAVHGSSERARMLCLRLVTALRMRPFEIADELRPLYHAAASAASNYIVTIATFAESLAATAGVSRDLLAPLARAAIDNWATLGAAALTGPVARGDETTVALQRTAVADRAPESLPLWDALVQATRDVAAQSPARPPGRRDPRPSSSSTSEPTSEDLH